MPSISHLKKFLFHVLRDILPSSIRVSLPCSGNKFCTRCFLVSFSSCCLVLYFQARAILCLWHLPCSLNSKHHLLLHQTQPKRPADCFWKKPLPCVSENRFFMLLKKLPSQSPPLKNAKIIGASVGTASLPTRTCCVSMGFTAVWFSVLLVADPLSAHTCILFPLLPALDS